jgi:hypothetical protein
MKKGYFSFPKLILTNNFSNSLNCHTLSYFIILLFKQTYNSLENILQIQNSFKT